GGARAAATALAYEAAAALYQWALELPLAQGATAQERRYDLLLALGTTQRRAGATAQAIATLHQAVDLARAMGAPERLADATLRLEDAAWASGLYEGPWLDVLQQPLHGLAEEDSLVRARLLSRLAFRSAL